MMTTIVTLIAALLGQAPAPTPSPTIAPADVQIAATLLAAPAERKSAATVLGYDADGKLVTLRAGTNDLICLADNPKDENFSAACYHKDLEPFMARGRALSASGVAGKEREAMRFKEIEAGTLAMPREPRTLYVLTGSAYRPRHGHRREGLRAVGDLSALCDGRVDGTVAQANTRRSVADGSRDSRRTHHDQSAARDELAVGLRRSVGFNRDPVDLRAQPARVDARVRLGRHERARDESQHSTRRLQVLQVPGRQWEVVDPEITPEPIDPANDRAVQLQAHSSP